MESATEAGAPTLFAAPVQTGEALAARVCRDLERDDADGTPPGVDLVAVARAAVDELEGARIKAFLPVLALRAAREARA
jgi:hypothetical protein